MPIFSIMVDSREPMWLRTLTFGGVPTASTMLDAGDVWVATEDALVIIERKTPNDLLNTLREGRLFSQCSKMREHSEWCYLVISGELQRGANGQVWADQRQTGWSWDSVQGALLTCMELGVGVVHCGSDTEFENTVVRLANRDRGAKRIPPPRVSHVLGHGEAVLAALPGVGMEKVDALLEHCGTPAWALVALTDETALKVPGVGNGTKAQVRRALGLEDWSELAVVSRKGEPNGRE